MRTRQGQQGQIFEGTASMSELVWTLTWDKCSICGENIQEYYERTGWQRTPNDEYLPQPITGQLLHSHCGCCKGTEYCQPIFDSQ